MARSWPSPDRRGRHACAVSRTRRYRIPTRPPGAGAEPLERLLIVNADDFGMSPGVNRGIFEAHERGIVTSASLMVHRPAAAEAAAYGARHPALGLGLHVDLGEWVYQDGSWIPRYEIVPTADGRAIERELDRQLRRFRRLTGRAPTHLDSHQHVHRCEPARGVALARAAALGIPLRSCDDRIRHCGDFYGRDARAAPYPDGITVMRLLEILAGLPTGVTELACHPGADPGPVEKGDPYAAERPRELATLCDARVHSAIVREGLKLVSFGDDAVRAACARSRARAAT